MSSEMKDSLRAKEDSPVDVGTSQTFNDENALPEFRPCDDLENLDDDS